MSSRHFVSHVPRAPEIHLAPDPPRRCSPGCGTSLQLQGRPCSNGRARRLVAVSPRRQSRLGLPSFDDSGWALLRTDASWSQQGHPKLDGFAWYRAKVVIPTGADNLIPYIPSVLTSYQVFANGLLLGGEGGMPPRTFPISQYHPRSVYSLPRAPRTAAHSVVIAIRVWHAPLWQDPARRRHLRRRAHRHRCPHRERCRCLRRMPLRFNSQVQRFYRFLSFWRDWPRWLSSGADGARRNICGSSWP